MNNLEAERMKNLDNWTETTRGIYRYVLSANFCYEIVVLTHYTNDNIMEATATAYASGEWEDKINGSVYSREIVLDAVPVDRCIYAVIDDYLENCK